MDNIFIERLKYEAVYLHELTDGFAAQRTSLNSFENFRLFRVMVVTSEAIFASYQVSSKPKTTPLMVKGVA